MYVYENNKHIGDYNGKNSLKKCYCDMTPESRNSGDTVDVFY
jgi:hypothetical protein